jgi:hypothetical protein
MAKTGKSVVNMGFKQPSLAMFIFCCSWLKSITLKQIKFFIQLDYIYNMENEFSNVLPYQLMPFIRKCNNKKIF